MKNLGIFLFINLISVLSLLYTCSSQSTTTAGFLLHLIFTYGLVEITFSWLSKDCRGTIQ